MRIGVYVCHCGGNISEVIDVKKVASSVEKQADVVVARDYEHMCSELGQKLVVDDIKEHKLDRVVIAACSPQFQGKTFMNTLESAGLSPYVLEMANIREQCAWPHFDQPAYATRKAEELTGMAIAKARLDESLKQKVMPIGKRVLVVGGGIAGIQTSLDLGDAGFEVWLVEKEPTIGGKMLQLSRTFPTEDCAACILSPKMADVPANPNIHLLTYSEVEDISGYIGNFKAKIRHKPRYVDIDKCTSCAKCVDACPVSMPSEVELGLLRRKAIYLPSPIAVPNKYLIDKRGIPPCKAACPAGVNAQGYVALSSQGKFKEALALEREENPLASICGRVCTHPCEADCKRGEFDEPIAIRGIKRFIADYEDELPEHEPVEQREGKVAIVGAGPSGLACAYHLAKRGYSATIFEALPVAGGMLTVGIPEFRLPRESIKRDIDYIKSWGVDIRLSSPVENPEKLLRDGYDALYLATGAFVERKLGIEGEGLGGVYYGIDFLRGVNFGKKVKVGKKVAVIGGGNSAIDAARTALRLGAGEVTIVYRRSRTEMPADEEEITAAEEEGIKVMYLTLPTKIIGKKKVEAVECIRMRLGEPDQTGRRRPIPIPGSEFIAEFDMVIPTIGQTPDLSYLADDTKLKRTKWDTLVVDDNTLQTAIPGIFAGGDVVTGPATAIEAIAAGKEAAISIDRFLRGVDLAAGRGGELEKVEEVAFPPNWQKEKREIPPTLPDKERVASFKETDLGLTAEQVRKEAGRCLACGGCVVCGECEKVCEAEAIFHAQKEWAEEIVADTIVVSTGYDIFDATQKKVYGYGRYENVVTALQMERMIVHASEGNPVKDLGKRIAFIQCVGSRDEQVGNEYCSRICCMYATKLSQLLKRSNPARDLYIFYTDLRAYGKGFEEYYKRAQREGVKFIRGRVAEAIEDSKTKKLTLKVEDTLTRQIIESEFDTVVLSVGLRPNRGTKKLANMLKLAESPDGFLQEAHPKFRPVDTLVDGVFLAGTVQGPKDIPDTVAQASAASSRAIRLMNQGEYALEPVMAFVHEDLCDGCGLCVEQCPLDAITISSNLAQVNEALCSGCGSCLSSCPRDALDLHCYRNDQLLAEIESALTSKKDGEIRILVFADDMATYRLADNVGTAKMAYSPDSRIIRVPSGSRVTPQLMLQAFALGADAILIGEAEEKSSPYPHSASVIKSNVAQVKDVLREEGIEGERLQFSQFVTVMLAGFVNNVNGLSDIVKGLGPIPAEKRKKLGESFKRGLTGESDD